MKNKNIPSELKKILDSVTNKRAKIVITHIMKHGFITTETLEKKYGYNHPPRAARDVREHGIPLETSRVKASDGRLIAEYRLGDLSKIQKGKLGGRTLFSKEFKEQLYKKNAGKCFICAGRFEARYLQVDHRIPYEISGEDKGINKNINHYMLLCGSCNRAKSWSCEHCVNWKTGKVPDICSRCYWGNPENYNHIALKNVRRADIFWEENEIEDFERLRRLSEKEKIRIPDFVKKTLKKHIVTSK